MLSFKDFIALDEAKRKPKEPDWPEADYASGYSQLRQKQEYLTEKSMRLQLFVPKRRDPKKAEQLKRDRDWRDIKKQFPDENLKESIPPAPVLTGFKESPPGDNKPGGAFWTSSVIEKPGNRYTSRWYEYVKTNYPDWQTDYGYLFEVSDSALVFSSSHLDQFYQWAENHGKLTQAASDWAKNQDEETLMRSNFPWDTMARYFDGVHHLGYTSRSYDFRYGWDVESTAWFNTNVLKYKGAVKLWDDLDSDD